LSRSAFTVAPSWVSTFFTPIFNYISLNILNILLKSFCLPLSLAVHFGISVYILLCCAFLCTGHTATFQFHHSFLFSILYSRYRISFLFCSDIFLTTVSIIALTEISHQLAADIIQSLIIYYSISD